MEVLKINSYLNTKIEFNLIKTRINAINQEKQQLEKIAANLNASMTLIETDLKEGDSVKIIDGPFNGMFGKVQNIDLENEKLNVLIDLFGQETPVEVDLVQISKC